MTGRNLTVFIFFFAFISLVKADDLGHSVAGDDAIEDALGSSKTSGKTPFLINGESSDGVESAKPVGDDYMFNHGVQEVSGKTTTKKQYSDFGYTMPGSFEGQENYLETDKVKMVKDFRKNSSSGLNLTFIKNDYDYQSTNDIINRTIGSGYKSVKGGSLFFRYDNYIMKTQVLNAHWAVGAGLGFSSGKGIFVDGTRSDTTFKLWEVPIDAGVGLEIPIAHWFKISGTAGPSFITLVQNRSDFQRGEKGKRKIQFSPGYFANAQFKVNLSGFSEETAYKIFTESEITNLYMNLEARLQGYSSFQDPIEVSGASFGVGFTFEYL